MRLPRWCTNAVKASLLLVLMGVRVCVGMRSMVRGSQARDVALGSNTLRGLQSTWHKDTREDERAASPTPLYNARKAFIAFLNNSERTKLARKEKKKNRPNRNNQIRLPREGPEGPPGRRGPQGPPGPPGGSLSTREMEEYIKDYLRDFLQQNKTVSEVNLADDSLERTSRMRVKAAFTATMPQPTLLKPSTLAIVDAFTITFSPGVFERRMVVEHGGFTVTKKGIYQVAASLVLHPRGRPNTPLRPLKDISVYLCITHCSKNSRRLEWSGSLGEGSVTAVLAGHLLLLRGDTLLLAVDNRTKRPLQVGTGSSFSAALIGT
ncbi:hypothetical protein OTU49_016976 [Cherax quadricarinatus]|uniref:C1q domain-containing protein n=1 Tax=Cherax quadricarinatus TaxID=27406 RepID=A0AAW0YA34_CHEQU|nr:adipolin-like [Cherax quadricarinatus]